MQQNNKQYVREEEDNIKGRIISSNENVDEQNIGNPRDISEIDKQEGNMKNGETGGAFKSTEDES